MRIAFVDTYPIRRGAQVFISELSEALELRKVQTARFYLYRAESQAAQVNLRVQDKVLGFSSNHFFEKIPTIQPGLLKALAQELLAFQPDIILLNGSRTLKYGAALKRFYPTKAKFISRIIDNAEFWNTGKFTLWYYKKFVVSQIDATIGVSQASLDSMIRHYYFKKPSTVIHRTFDSNKFSSAPSRKDARQKLGLKEEDEVLLFLGNLTTQKRPDRFLEIVAQLSKTRPKLKALLVGDGPMRRELEEQMAGIEYQVSSTESQEPRAKSQEMLDEEGKLGKSDVLNLASCVFFKGYQQDVSPYLAAADLLILTSDTEGLPGVVLEAAYFEVPSVASEVGGIRECLMDGQTGFLIQDRSIPAFCAKIDWLLDQPDLRKDMGAKAKALVADNFQMEKIAGQYLDFFESLMLLSTHR